MPRRAAHGIERPLQGKSANFVRMLHPLPSWQALGRLIGEALVDMETAQAVGPYWGYGLGVPGDPGPWDGELRNMGKPTAQRDLRFMGGNLAQVRAMSRYLALQLRRAAQQRAGG